MQIVSWDFTTTGTGAWQQTGGGSVMSAIATVAGNGALTLGAVIEVTNNPGDLNAAINLFTLSASGTNGANDSKSDQACWPWARARCTGISGTNAKAQVSLSIGG